MAHKELRSEVAKLRALVKTARTNIVRKLLRDRKFWSNKLTASSDNRRAAKKAEASEAISQHIRSLRTYQLVKDVIRFEARKNDPSTKVSTDIADRTLLRFHADTKLSSAVKALVDRFELRRNDPLIDKVVQESRVKTSESTDDTARKKKKKPKLNTAKAKKVQSKVDKPKSQKPKSKASEKTKSIAKDETDEDEDEQSDHSITMSADHDTTDESDTADERSIEKSKDKSKPELPAKQSKKKRNKKGMPSNLKPPEEDDEDEDGSMMVQDSFFVTESGGNYVAVAPVLKTGEQESSDEGAEAEQSWKLSFKRKKNLESGPPNTSNGSQTGQRGKGKEGNKPTFATADDARPAKRNRKDQGKVEAEPDLHPSWLAKQKQKGIQHFAGKKVVFDEDTSSKGKPNEDLHPSWAAKQAQKGIKPFAGRKTVFDDESAKPKGAPVDDLHPSWAAKQAQKGIKPFAGKKITFDEDSSAAPIVKSANDLHPSWAAKQAQKGIKPFAGKKLIFGDQGANGPQSASKEVETDLHPSWVAKQAQKGLKPFAGKKTTFDDDETTPAERRKTARTKDSPMNGETHSAKFQSVTNDLHPSWAAKQAQKGIKQFEGKKISFGD